MFGCTVCCRSYSEIQNVRPLMKSHEYSWLTSFMREVYSQVVVEILEISVILQTNSYHFSACQLPKQAIHVPTRPAGTALESRAPMTQHRFRCCYPECPRCPSKHEMACRGSFTLLHPQHSHPHIYCGLNLDIAIALLKPMPSPLLQTWYRGVFDTISPRLILTVHTVLPVFTTPCLGIAIIEGILGALHASFL